MAFSLVAELLFFDEKKTSKTRVLHETSRRGMHKHVFSEKCYLPPRVRTNPSLDVEVLWFYSAMELCVSYT